jgi:hypothetical protein
LYIWEEYGKNISVIFRACSFACSASACANEASLRASTNYSNLSISHARAHVVQAKIACAPIMDYFD